jgi:hypothetical protein
MIKCTNKLILFFLCCCLSFCANRKNSYELIVPGVFHFHYVYEALPWSIHVLKIDLTASHLKLTSTLAFDRLAGNEKTSEQARRRNRRNEYVVAAVNADFFGLNGVPTGIQIIEGVPIKSPSPHAIFALSDLNKPIIELVQLDAKLIFADGRELALNGINRVRYSDEAILYNRYKGTYTETNQWGREIILRLVQPLFVGKANHGIVAMIAENEGNKPIPMRNGCVISAHGTAAELLAQSVQREDTVTIDLRIPPIKTPVRLAVGGIPRILRNGRVSIEIEEEGIQPKFATSRHPRTAIGYSRDEKTLFLVTVDGRQPNHSIGMTLDELADFMLRLGCYQALNLDGGGSTTMVIGDKVINRPSDPAGERAVANALVVLSRIPPKQK